MQTSASARPAARSLVVILAAILTWTAAGTAQTGSTLSGRLLNSLSGDPGDPIGGATVQVDELRRQVVSAADGTFTVDNVPPGTYHLSVRSAGYSSRRTEVTVGPTPGSPVEVTVDPELHFQDVVTVGPTPRSQFDSFQPTAVLAGQELTKQLEGSLGATLDQQPGVASRSFGPGPARPVVRGLDGDRVQILQDGQRMGDVSSQSGDHGVTFNPAAAERIEVVRGPATLLYGANAVGGLVNIITNDIPTRAIRGATGNFTFDTGTAASEGGAAGSVQMGNGTFALNLGGGGRRAGEVGTPDGDVTNSQSRNGFGTVGGGWTGERGYLGASYGYTDTKYGIPVVEGGVLQLTPRRHAFTVRGGGQNLDGPFDEVRATVAVRRYKHDELEGDEVGTAFTNNTADLDLLGSHRAIGPLKGSVGVWVLNRDFEATGAEALSPPVNERRVAAYVYEELTWPHVTLQFGGRVDNARFRPLAEPERTFTNTSGSVGALFRPAAANDRLTIAASLGRAARNPALEELFFFGEHHGNFAIELGNPDLRTERALGFDLSLRWRGSRASGEITYFRNSIDDFIFRQQISEEEFEAREEEFEARFPGRTLAGHEHEDHEHEDGEHEEHEEGEEGLAIVDFVAADAVLHGVEFHADAQVAPRIFAEFGADFVRGRLQSGDESLPRIPPFRIRGGLRYQSGGLQAGGQVLGANRQTRVYGTETPTDGYTVLRLFASYSLTHGHALHTITARLDNATNELYRNHLSLIKDVVPEMGRNFKLLYNVRF